MQSRAVVRKPNEAILDAAVRVIAEDGWDALTLEHVAAKARLNRVTIWRQGVRKEALLDALLQRLSRDYREAMWPTLAAAGSARDRLENAIAAVCKVAEANLALLMASDSVLHRASAVQSADALGFSEAFARLAADGARDGSLRFVADARKSGSLLFNTVCYSYIHLRTQHRWPAAQIQNLLTSLVMNGCSARRHPGSGRR
jgi:AcrR family transcriptional regulator